MVADGGQFAAIGLWLEANFAGAAALMLANLALTVILLFEARSRISYDPVAHRLSEKALIELQTLKTERLGAARAAAAEGRWDEVKSFITAMQKIIKDEHAHWKAAKAA